MLSDARDDRDNQNPVVIVVLQQPAEWLMADYVLKAEALRRFWRREVARKRYVAEPDDHVVRGETRLLVTLGGEEYSTTGSTADD